VGQHERVVVYIDNAGLRRDPLSNLVGVVDRRQAGADIEELMDSHLTGKVRHGTDEKSSALAGSIHDSRKELANPVTGLAVDSVVVLTAQPVVPDPGRVWHPSVDLVPWFVVSVGRADGHWAPSHAALESGRLRNRLVAWFVLRRPKVQAPRGLCVALC
jgi:hypothetical protein